MPMDSSLKHSRCHIRRASVLPTGCRDEVAPGKAPASSFHRICRTFCGLTLTTALLFAFAPGLHAQAESDAAPDVVSSSAGELRVEQLATLEYPWGMALLPDERLLITEKPGRLRIWEDGSLSDPVEGVPDVVYRDSPTEQGGLLDVALDPDFTNNNLIYLSYVEAAEQQPSAMAETGNARFGGYLDMSDNVVRGGAVARGRLEDGELHDVEVIWRQVPKTLGRGHFGNSLVFGQDDKLYITSGDRMRFEPAQDLTSNLGKVLRINADGSVPDDNPFVGEEDARQDIWSYGHRNILAMLAHPSSGQLWGFEMGPLGGDEVNLIQSGKNYGWPTVSNGAHYNGQPIPGHPSTDEFQPPVRTWTPVISPSGATFYDGAMLPAWRGNVLVGGLSSQAIVRLVLEGDRIAIEERIEMQRRVRDVTQGPDGAILIIVDEAEGGLLRLTTGN